jgi:hypothetical protein
VSILTNRAALCREIYWYNVWYPLHIFSNTGHPSQCVVNQSPHPNTHRVRAPTPTHTGSEVRLTTGWPASRREKTQQAGRRVFFYNYSWEPLRLIHLLIFCFFTTTIGYFEARRDRIISRLDHVCGLLQPLLELLNLSVMEGDWKPYEAYSVALQCATLCALVCPSVQRDTQIDRLQSELDVIRAVHELSWWRREASPGSKLERWTWTRMVCCPSRSSRAR